jgi:hypothetical protein
MNELVEKLDCECSGARDFTEGNDSTQKKKKKKMKTDQGQNVAKERRG